MATRTTVRLEDDLLAQAKVHAAANGKSLNQVVEEALRRMLASGPQAQQVRPHFPTADGKGLRPGIDLDSAVGLHELGL